MSLKEPKLLLRLSNSLARSIEMFWIDLTTDVFSFCVHTSYSMTATPHERIKDSFTFIRKIKEKALDETDRLFSWMIARPKITITSGAMSPHCGFTSPVPTLLTRSVHNTNRLPTSRRTVPAHLGDRIRFNPNSKPHDRQTLVFSRCNMKPITEKDAPPRNQIDQSFSDLSKIVIRERVKVNQNSFALISPRSCVCLSRKRRIGQHHVGLDRRYQLPAVTEVQGGITDNNLRHTATRHEGRAKGRAKGSGLNI